MNKKWKPTKLVLEMSMKEDLMAKKVIKVNNFSHHIFKKSFLTALMTVGKVKKIIKADPEIRKVSKASCEYIIKLTEAFGSFLLQEVEKNMKAEKKKKPGMNDLGKIMVEANLS